MHFKIDPRAEDVVRVVEQGGFPGLADEIRSVLFTGRISEELESPADGHDAPRVHISDPQPYDADEQFDIALDMLVSATIGRVRLLKAAEDRLKDVTDNPKARLMAWVDPEVGAVPAVPDDAVRIADRLEHLLGLARNMRTLDSLPSKSS